jgi:hypothetical protein
LAIGVTGLAGCTSSTGDGAPTKSKEERETSGVTETTKQLSVEVPEIKIVNKHSESHQFHVLVLDGETPVFWRSYTTEAAEIEDGRTAKATGTVWKDPAPESENLTLYARVDDRTEWKNWSPSDGDDCVSVEVQLETDGRLHLWTGYPEC